jgi:hypothetical protein
MIDKYKKYYKDKLEELKIQLYEIKDGHINSYLTYDSDYYLTQYNKSIEDINKYLFDIDGMDVDEILKNSLCKVSISIDLQFPGYLLEPSLLGKI